MTDLTIEQSQNAVALAAQQMTQDKAQAYELVGMIKAFDFTQKLVTVTTLKLLAEIKENNKYKGLELLNSKGEVVTVTTWANFCTTLGFSREQMDENLRNLNTFGENFLETSQRLGLGYREMRKLRQLPEEARAEIVEADYSNVDDKEELIEKLEDLTAKFSQEKKVLEGKLAQSQANYEAQSKVLANKNKRIDDLDAELQKKKQHINTLTPDQKGGLLRKEAVQIAYGAEAILRGQVFQAFEALTAHTQETGVDHKQFMSGVLAEYQLILSELKEHFNLDDEPSGSNIPEWARPDSPWADKSDLETVE